jgi:hypothetical protein
VQHVRWCLCVPDELPHVNFSFDAKGIPHGRRVTNADLNREYKPLVNHTVCVCVCVCMTARSLNTSYLSLHFFYLQIMKLLLKLIETNK